MDDDSKKKELENEKKDDWKNLSLYADAASGQKAVSLADGIEKKFAKPDKYNRQDYDSGSAKYNYKNELFKSGKTAKDPYSGQKLVKTNKEAKAIFKKDYKDHVAEVDHIDPLKAIHEEYKKSAFTTLEEIKEAANSPENLHPLSRTVNNAKRSKTPDELSKDLDYLKKKGLPHSKKARKKMKQAGEKAHNAIEWKLQKAAFENVADTFHKSGLEGGKAAGTMVGIVSGVTNFYQVLTGEKKFDEALKDTAEAAGKAIIGGYLTAGGISVSTQLMRSSTQELIKSLGNANAPAVAIQAVAVVGDSLTRFVDGEISAEECFIELQKNGAALIASNIGMSLGQALIPIPIVGAAVGAMVATAVIGFVENTALKPYYQAKTDRKAYARQSAAINRINHAMVMALQAQKQRLEELQKQELQRRQQTFQLGMESMLQASLDCKVEQLTDGLQTILSYFGEECYFKNREQFDEFFDNPLRKPFVL